MSSVLLVLATANKHAHKVRCAYTCTNTMYLEATGCDKKLSSSKFYLERHFCNKVETVFDF